MHAAEKLFTLYLLYVGALVVLVVPVLLFMSALGNRSAAPAADIPIAGADETRSA